MKNLLADFPIVIEMPVAWGEMDAFQHVNNIVYFRYFETARIAYFKEMNFLDSLEKKGIGPILASIDCRFKIPITYPDRVSAGVRVKDFTGDRIIMHHIVVSHKARKIAAEGDGLVVAYNYREKKKAALPDEIKKRIRELEGT